MKIWEHPYSDFRGREKDITVLFPIGLTGEHGSHLATGADILVPQDIAEKIDERIENGLMLFPLAYGTGIKEERFKICVTESTFERLIEEILCSMISQGFLKFVLINGHNENLAAVEKVLQRLRKESSETKFMCVNWWSVLGEKTRMIFGEKSDYAHSGQLETSVMLGIDSKLVNLNRLRSQNVIDKEEKNFPCTKKCEKYSCYANLEAASASKGKITIEDSVEQIILSITNM